MAALAYPFWFIVFPLVYMTPDKRNVPFLKFHAYQGAALGLCGVAGLSLVRTVLSLMFRWFILFDILLFPLLKILEWVVLMLVVYGAISAFSGKYAEIPVLSGFIRSLDKPADSE